MTSVRPSWRWATVWALAVGMSTQIHAQLPEGCGGSFTDTRGDISSPDWPNNYQQSTRCDYLIQVPEDSIVHLDFQSIDIEDSLNCSLGSIKIYDGSTANFNNLMSHVCGSQIPPTTVSSSNSMLVVFTSGDSNNSGGSFEATYIAEAKTCGGSFSGVEGQIKSPSWPNNYWNYADCTYQIEVAFGRHIALTFSDFQLEDHQCATDYVEIFDGHGLEVHIGDKLCGNGGIDRTFISNGNKMSIVFTSDSSVTMQGFQASFTAIQKATLSPPSLTVEPSDSMLTINSLHGLRFTCQQTITTNLLSTYAFFHNGIELHRSSLNDYSIESNDVEVSSTGSYTCISIIEDVESNHSNILNKTIIDCGGVYEQDHGVITSPIWPSKYLNYAHCEYLLTVKNGSHVLLDFVGSRISIHSSYVSSNNRDVLKVFDGPDSDSPEIVSWYGSSNVAPVVSTGNVLFVQFFSNERYNSGGFQANYSSIIEMRPDTPTITKNNLRLTCSEVVHSINVTFTFFKYSEVVKSGSSNILDLDATSPSGNYSCKATLYEVVSSESEIITVEVCGGLFNNSIGQIVSPNWPGNYEDNSYCEYLIEVEAGKIVYLEFDVFDVHTSWRYDNAMKIKSRDFVEVYDGSTTKDLIIFQANQNHEDNFSIISSGKYLLLVLTSDSSYTKKGFSANFTAIQELQEVELKTPILSFHRTSFQNQLQLFDYKYVYMYCRPFIFGQLMDYVFFKDNNMVQNSSRLWLRIYHVEMQDYAGNYTCNVSVNGLGFPKSNNVTIDVDECTISIDNNTIQSVDWPGKYDTQCGYLIEVEEGSHVLLSFTHFDLDDKSYWTDDDFPNCGRDYLKVFDGASRDANMIQQKWCSDKKPPTILSSQNMLFVSFTTDRYNLKGEGFKAKYMSTIKVLPQAPTLTLMPSEIVVEGTTSVTFTCSQTLPVSLSTWYRILHNGVEIYFGTSRSFTISMVQASHAGTYHCLAVMTQVESSARAGVTLKVVGEDYEEYQQRELYPYGLMNGDTKLQASQRSPYHLDTLGVISEPLKFSGGFPFGKDRFSFAHVLPHGVITVGQQKNAHFPDLQNAAKSKIHVIAPFWSYMYPNKGNVFYQMYKRLDSGSGIAAHVLNRSSSEVQEYLTWQGLSDGSEFKATSVLVVTWQEVEPMTVTSILCDFIRTGCNDVEKNTFQTLLITDGIQSFVLTTYKSEEMNWKFEYNRRVAVGFMSPTPAYRKDYNYFNSKVTTRLDVLYGSAGRFGTFIDIVGLKRDNFDALCEQWYFANAYLVGNLDFEEDVDDLWDCPCSLDRLGAQWEMYSRRQTLDKDHTFVECHVLTSRAVSWLNRWGGQWGTRRRTYNLNKVCCYNIVESADSYDQYGYSFEDARKKASFIQDNDPAAGHILLHNPWGSSARASISQDMRPHAYCCRDSSRPGTFCPLFKQVRPIEKCNVNAIFLTANGFGDPHIKTGDGVDYTMNGIGEYVLLMVAEERFTLQGRTGLATTAEGNITKASVFVAFAAQEANGTFQVELNDALDGMVVSANGQDITREIYSIDSFQRNYQDSLSIERNIGDLGQPISVTASFPSSISVTVFAGIRSLEFSVKLPDNLRGKAEGLMGNFDGDKTNDFILPNKTVLSNESTYTERDILETFADAWRVTENTTVFAYEIGKSTLDFQNFTFEPLFLDEVNQTKVEQAKTACDSDFACVYDLIATGDEAFAKYSKASNTKADKIKKDLANTPPSITVLSNVTFDGYIEVEEGNLTYIAFNATDQDGHSINYTLVNTPLDVQIDALTGIVTLTPDLSNPVAIGVRAQDSQGAYSVTQYVTLALCSSCGGRGICDLSDTQEAGIAGGRFLVHTCLCRPAYTGNLCESTVDGCASTPCLEGQECVNLRPDDRENSERRFICGPTPAGFVTMEGFPVDQNECLNITHPVCPSNSHCVNSVGSFSCHCDSGYRPGPGDVLVCNDINECDEGTSKCQQACYNTKGGYVCSCLKGNILALDARNCYPEVSLEAKCALKVCNDTCYAGQDLEAECGCSSGFELVNGTQCQDIDECSHATQPCSQMCNNTVGGFECFCYAGFSLSGDRTSCEACEVPFYGKNCAGVCSCSGRGLCDLVRGCVCTDGWTGDTCSQDLDECVVLDLPCPLVKHECVNSMGGYSCQCRAGYHMDNGTCIDVDECADMTAHNCSLDSQTCLNTLGSFGCVCNAGLARSDDRTCLDIDECSIHSHQCQQSCVNTEGSYSCGCLDGYKLDTDRLSCQQYEDQCAESGLQCEHVCSMNLTSNATVCQCHLGYELQGSENCSDIDECGSAVLNLCGHIDGCVNTEGSFLCSCSSGHTLDNDGRGCVECSGGRWGDNCTNACECGQGASHCDPKVGCICRDGFSGDACHDTDECLNGTHNCTESEICVNLQGGFRCDCVQGLYKVEGICIDKDECASNTDNICSQVCENTNGSYSCSCYGGFEMNNNTCKDINECIDGSTQCQGHCENTEGGFRCSCTDGFTLMEDRRTCTDFDECALSVSNLCQQNCHNTNGSFTCSCHEGYNIAPDAYVCDDIDECSSSDPPCEQMCGNTDGSYTCSCTSGYETDDDDDTQCYEALTTTFVMTLDLDVPALDLENHEGQDYIQMRNMLEMTVKDRLAYSTTRVILSSLSFRHGSVVADVIVTSDRETDVMAASHLAVSLVDIIESGLMVNGSLVTVTIDIANQSMISSLSGCAALQLVEPCPVNHPCVYTDEGMAYCKPNILFHCGRYSQSCVNGGACAAETGECSCTAPYSGYACHVDDSTLTPDPKCPLQCEHGGECVMSGDVQACLCAPDYIGELCQDNRVDISCSGENITIRFTPLQNFEGVAFIGHDKDISSCQLNRESEESLIGVFPLDMSCDGMIENRTENGDKIYKKELSLQFSSMFLLPHDLVLNVSCFHSSNTTREVTGDLGTGGNIDGGQTPGEEITENYEPATLEVLSNPGMAELSGPVTLGQRVYLANYLMDTSVYKSLYVKQCSATDPDNQKTIIIIQDGCPAPNTGVLFSEDAEGIFVPGVGVRHNMMVFKLEASTVRMSFVCVVKLCEDAKDCSLPNCSSSSSRVKRQTDLEPEIPVTLSKNERRTVAQITIYDPNSETDLILGSGNSSDDLVSDLQLPVILLACACLALLLSCVALVIYILHSRSGKATPAPIDVSADMMAWFHMPRARHDKPAF